MSSKQQLRTRAIRGLQLDPALVTRVLQGFVRDEIGKFGINRAVVALSGGIDSALSCALAVRALGSDSVLAVLMPYRTSNPASRSDAETLVRQLNIASVLIDISPAVDGITDQLHDKPSDLRRGNVMARTRMTALYDQSASFGGLGVGTSNKTELLLGYGTQHGDMASAVNPIGDLYKTQVQTLSEALDIPNAILEKTPSAALWEGQ